MKYTFRHTRNACYLGYITQAIINNLAPLLFIIFQDSFHISFEMIGRLILINFGAQLIVDLLAVKFVDKIGYRTSAVLAHLCAALGLICLSVLPNLLPSPYLGLCIAVIIYAIGGGLTEVLISPIVDSLPSDGKAASMSLLHSFYCWGQVAVVFLSTIALKIFGNDIWYLLPLVWSVIPIYNLFRFTKVPLMPAVAEDEKIPLKKLFSSRLFLLAIILMLCAGASELSMSQWSSLFAEKGLHVSKVVGDLLGPCLFAIFMGTGRLLYAWLGDRLPLKKALIGSALLCVICYLVTVFAPLPLLSLFGCAFCGFSVALMWPGVFSLSAQSYPTGGTAMFGILALAGDLGCSVGPWLAGLFSDLVQKSDSLLSFGASHGLTPDQLGLKCGMLIAVIFPLIMLFTLFLLKTPQHNKGREEVPDADASCS